MRFIAPLLVSIILAASASAQVSPSTLQTLINDNITTNGTGAITGRTLNGVLTQMNNSYYNLSTILPVGNLPTWAQFGGIQQTYAQGLQRTIYASDYAGVDIGAKINAAIFANPGARIVVSAGVYLQTTTIHLTHPTFLECSVAAGNSTSSVVYPACVLVAATPTTTALTCYDNEGRGSGIKGFAFEGGATVANTTDGVIWACNQPILDDISISGFGQDGILFWSGTGINPNAPSVYLFGDSGVTRNVVSNYNKRDGIAFAGADSNVWTALNFGASSNGRYGYNITSPWNTLITPLAAFNGSYDFNIMTYTRLINTYCESGGHGYYIDSGAAGTILDTTAGTGLSGTCPMTGAGVSNSLITSVGPSGTGVVMNRVGVAVPGSSYGYSFTPNTVNTDDLCLESQAAVMWCLRSSTNKITNPGIYGIGVGNGYTAPTETMSLGGVGAGAGTLGLHDATDAHETVVQQSAGVDPTITLPATTGTLAILGANTFTANQSAPRFISTTAAPAISSCGGGTPSVAANSTSVAGQFTTGTGAPTACTITFNTAWPTDSFCVISAASSGAAAVTILPYVSAHSASAFTVTFAAGLTSGSFNYHCEGK